MTQRPDRNRDRSYSQRQNSRNYDRQDQSRDGGFDKQRKYEEYAWTLAYLSEGSPTDPAPFSSREPVVQAVGDIWFTLLELSPKSY